LVALLFGRAIVAPEDADEKIALQGRLRPIHPAVDMGSLRGVIGPEACGAVSRREVAQDRMRLPHCQLAVLEHRHSAMRIERAEGGLVQATEAAARGNLLIG